jgi:hypothetical protein
MWRLLQTGIVVTYARSFDGKAKLGGRWRPTDEEQRRLHNGIIGGRGEMLAHADNTPHRAALYIGGELNIVEPGLHPEVLSDMATMCEVQAERFETEANRLLESIKDVLVPSGSLSEAFGTLRPPGDHEPR